jgi:type I restriction enzyme S subunit
MSYKRLGDYIQLVDKRNKDLAVTNLLGINITKNFMPSVANVSGTDLSKYKVIKEGQFAYSAMQVAQYLKSINQLILRFFFIDQ